jgi:hypothetical protein
LYSRGLVYPVKEKHLKDKINELATNVKNKIRRDMYRGVMNLKGVTNLEVT